MKDISQWLQKIQPRFELYPFCEDYQRDTLHFAVDSRHAHHGHFLLKIFTIFSPDPDDCITELYGDHARCTEDEPFKFYCNCSEGYTGLYCTGTFEKSLGLSKITSNNIVLLLQFCCCTN